MTRFVDAHYTPADFEALSRRDLTSTVCVVFDVLRATSSMITALANGAKEIVPAAEISEALALRKADPTILLAGERDGVLITSALTGSIPFDFGNSPREFTSDKIVGRRIAITTTNGTRALRACAQAKTVFVASFLNLSATAEAILAEKPDHLFLLCSGTYEQAAYEDTLGAGALLESLKDLFNRDETGDGAFMAHQLYIQSERPLFKALSASRNGRRLLTRPELSDDVQFCSQIDTFPLVARLDKHGAVAVRRLP